MGNGEEKKQSVSAHPDPRTKRDTGLAYGFALSALLFLSLQVWNLGGKIERLIAQNEAQQRWNERMERSVETMNQKIDRIQNSKGN